MPSISMVSSPAMGRLPGRRGGSDVDVCAGVNQVDAAEPALPGRFGGGCQGHPLAPGKPALIQSSDFILAGGLTQSAGKRWMSSIITIFFAAS